MTTENIPTQFGLLLANFRETHGSGEANHAEHDQTDGEFIGNDLCTSTHRTDKRKLVVGRPPSEQNAHYTHTTHSQEEEHAHIEINDLRAFVPRQASKGDHRSRHHEERRDAVQELVSFAEIDDFLGHHLEHVANHLQQAPLTHTVRTDAALESCADFTLCVNHDDGEDGVDGDDNQSYQHAFHQDCQAVSHPSREQAVQPSRHDRKIKHNMFCYWVNP